MAIKPVRKTKSPPTFSQEFFIQNHGDIVSCVAMVFVLGMMFQVSAPIATSFVILQHVITPESNAPADDPIYYTNGSQDFAAIFFYTLICVVVHAIIQEYGIDKVNRKLHLSKSRNSKFNECGQLLIFNAFAAAWGLFIIAKDESITSLSSLWLNYPEDHVKMTIRMKFFFIFQISYWLHNFPELYLQKVKREDISERILYSTLHLIFISAAYAFNFTRLAVVLLTFHYTVEAVIQGSRLLVFAEMAKPAAKGFNAYNIMFPIFRLLSLMLTILTVQMGLGGADSEQGIDIETGNFNTPLIRLLSVVSVSAVQGWMVWRFVTFHLRKKRERLAELAAAQKKKQQQAKAAKKPKKSSDEDVALLPEVDQNTRRRR